MDNLNAAVPEILGFGLARDSVHKIALDQSVSPVWTSEHVFTRPIIFPSSQTIHVSYLSASQQDGDLLAASSGIWGRLPVGAPGDVLTVAAGRPIWGSLDLSAARGLLPASMGGTGLSSPVIGGILVGDTNGSWAQISQGKTGEILTFTASGPSWAPVPSLTGSGKPSHVALWADDGTLENGPLILSADGALNFLKFTSSSPAIQLCDGRVGGIALVHEGRTLVIGLNDSAIGNRNNELFGAALKFDLRPGYRAQYLRLTVQEPLGPEATIVAFDVDGWLTQGTVPIDRLSGTIPVTQGGTGLASLQRGDILFASSATAISRLSANGADGLYLKMVNGLPSWCAGGIGGLDVGMLTPLLLPPVKLSPAPVVGMMEWDGSGLYFTSGGNTRKVIAYTDGDISGSAENVTGIVGLTNGGTGADLTLRLSTGNLLCVQANLALGWLLPGSEGQALCSSGPEKPLAWMSTLHGVSAGEGISVGGTDPFAPIISLNTTASLTWLEPQSFNEIFLSRISLELGKFRPHAPNSAAESGELWWDGDHLYFRREGTTVNLTSGATPAQTHIICLGEELSPSPGQRRRARIPLPYGADGFSPVRWNFRRLDWRAEVAPTSSASVQVWIGDTPLLSPPLTLTQGQDASFATQFSLGAATSGELLQIEFGESGESDAWSLYLLIESS